MRPAAKRGAVQYLQEHYSLSQRRACGLIGCPRETARHVSTRQDDAASRQRLKELADENRAWGYRLLCGRLKLEGFEINHKRVYRLYKEEKLAQRPRGRKRLKGDKQGHPPDPTHVNEVWALDFMSDAIANGRSFRTLNVIDGFTRQCHSIVVDTSLCGYRVQRAVEDLFPIHGKPKALQMDNGPELRCNQLREWAQEQGIELRFIEPGKPNQNGRIESFNSRFREECLNQEWFVSLPEARTIIENWRLKYNQQRPHSSLNYLPPDLWTQMHLDELKDQNNVILPSPNNRAGRTEVNPSSLFLSVQT